MAKIPLLTSQSSMERSGKGRVSQDLAGGKGRERDHDKGRSEVQEVEMSKYGEDFEQMEEEKE